MSAIMNEPREGAVSIEGAPKLRSRVSLQAIVAGAVVAIAVGFMLNVLGIAVGATTIDPMMPGETPDAGTITLVAGIWLLVSSLIGLGLGGYTAARLSGNVDKEDSALHGLAVWGVAFLFGAAVAGGYATSAARTAAQGAGSAIGGVAQGIGSAAGQVAGAAGQVIDPQAALERARSALTRRADPEQMTSEQRMAEIGSIAAQRIASGSYEAGARDRLQALIAAEAGITPAEAGQRIDQAETQARQAAQTAEQRAREAADAAAKGVAVASFWGFAALLLGAVAAALGSMAGARRAAYLSGRDWSDRDWGAAR
ncbi:hypothetical protein [Plastoroseomonas hellenica]|uniref:hypothetical protein n=1 Tax=Plastoroseomonas hellenica TaxID=2687306 RepID=UPI001BACEC75|nr:hypothetical protein [Plastoroseomonas hellenica]